MADAARKFETSDADRMQSAVAALTKRQRCVPQAYDELGELIAVRTLLRLGRNDEALERLEHTLDRYYGSWR